MQNYHSQDKCIDREFRISQKPHPIIVYFYVGEITAITLVTVKCIKLKLSYFVHIQLQNLNDQSGLATFHALDDVSMLLYHAGFGNEPLTSDMKDKVIQCVLIHQVFRSRRVQIEDLKTGLQKGLLLNLLRSNLSCLSIAFPLADEHVITSENILPLVRPVGTLSQMQEKIFNWYKEYIQRLGQCILYCMHCYSNSFGYIKLYQMLMFWHGVHQECLLQKQHASPLARIAALIH